MKIPILETGNSRGFTLLEILAVLTLLGLAIALVMPSFYLRDERTEVDYIGKLMVSDLSLLESESRVNHSEITVTFSKTGYQIEMGSKSIERNFRHYNFEITQPQKSTESSDGSEPSTETKEIIQLGFIDGTCNAANINWQTIHFSGSMSISTSGELRWNYSAK